MFEVDEFYGIKEEPNRLFDDIEKMYLFEQAVEGIPCLEYLINLKRGLDDKYTSYETRLAYIFFALGYEKAKQEIQTEK